MNRRAWQLPGSMGPIYVSIYIAYIPYLFIYHLSIYLLSIYITDLSSYLLSISSIGSVSLEN